MWQPSEKSLRNVELDEAGKLAAFRERFGRGYDISSEPGAGEETSERPAQDAFADLITGYAPQAPASMKDSGPKKAPARRK
jgi:hypothetical protein